jgi:nucleotide-binding universal stress UspA family protein
MSLGQVIFAVPLLTLLGAASLRADLSKARAEPGLEKRARLALDNSNTQFRAASTACKNDDMKSAVVALEEVRDSVELAYTALKQTNKKPRNSREYKNFEIKTRQLLKSLDDLRQRIAVDEREHVESVAAYIQQVHDEALNAVMGITKAGTAK